MESGIAIAAVLVAVAALVLNIVLAVRNGQWGLPDRLNRLEGKIMAAVKEHRDHTDTMLDATRQELDQAIDRSRREFGETVHAIQSKIQQFELYVRDTFVRRDSFLAVIKENKDALEKHGNSVARRLDNLDAKLDGMIARQMARMTTPTDRRED